MGETFGSGFASGFIKNMSAALDKQGHDMLLWDLLQPSLSQLDNSILKNGNMPRLPESGDENMAYKINRSIMVGGQRKWIHANTEQEYVDKIMALMGATVFPETEKEKEKHLFSDYARHWFDVFGKSSVETVTAICYKRQIDIHLIPAFADRYIEDITTADIQEMFNNMGDCAKETKKKAKTVLGMILDCAVEDNLIAKNPIHSKRLRIHGKQSTETAPYSVEEMRYLVAHICDLTEDRDRAYLALHTLHPLRLEEVLGLRWRDVDMENNLIHVKMVVTHPARNRPEIKSPKTEQSVRTLELSPECKKYLCMGNSDDFVVGGSSPLSYTQVRRMCNRIKKQTGFEGNITPIRFRTTILTDLYDRTKDIKLTQAAAGHSTPDMTLRYYVKGRTGTAESKNTVTRLYTEAPN